MILNTLKCAATLLVGFSVPPTKPEIDVVISAKKVCTKKYPESPCLVKIIKKEELVYNAICGAPKRNSALDFGDKVKYY